MASASIETAGKQRGVRPPTSAHPNISFCACTHPEDRSVPLPPALSQGRARDLASAHDLGEQHVEGETHRTGDAFDVGKDGFDRPQ